MWLQRFFRNGWMVALIVGVATVLQGCFSEKDIYNPSDYIEQDLEAIEAYIASNNLDVKYDTGAYVYYQVHQEGDEYQAVRATNVLMHYKGMTLDGREFVNTFNGNPESIYIGIEDINHQYNPSSYSWGLDSWMLGRREGDSLTVFLPSFLGFQDGGYGVVTANTPIMYHVKFVDIPFLSEEQEEIDQYIDGKGWTSEIEPYYGMRYVVHESGDQGVKIEQGDFISIFYEGRLLNDTIFDSNFDRSTWDYTYGVGDVNTITGFGMGLELLHKGDSATFFIPSIYGYGAQGNLPTIPVNAPLRFTMKIENVIKQ